MPDGAINQLDSAWEGGNQSKSCSKVSLWNTVWVCNPFFGFPDSAHFFGISNAQHIINAWFITHEVVPSFEDWFRKIVQLLSKVLKYCFSLFLLSDLWYKYKVLSARSYTITGKIVENPAIRKSESESWITPVIIHNL